MEPPISPPPFVPTYAGPVSLNEARGFRVVCWMTVASSALLVLVGGARILPFVQRSLGFSAPFLSASNRDLTSILLTVSQIVTGSVFATGAMLCATRHPAGARVVKILGGIFIGVQLIAIVASQIQIVMYQTTLPLDAIVLRTISSVGFQLLILTQPVLMWITLWTRRN